MKTKLYTTFFAIGGIVMSVNTHATLGMTTDFDPCTVVSINLNDESVRDSRTQFQSQDVILTSGNCLSEGTTVRFPLEFGTFEVKKTQDITLNDGSKLQLGKLNRPLKEIFSIPADFKVCPFFNCESHNDNSTLFSVNNTGFVKEDLNSFNLKAGAVFIDNNDINNLQFGSQTISGMIVNKTATSDTLFLFDGSPSFGSATTQAIAFDSFVMKEIKEGIVSLLVNQENTFDFSQDDSGFNSTPTADFSNVPTTKIHQCASLLHTKSPMPFLGSKETFLLIDNKKRRLFSISPSEVNAYDLPDEIFRFSAFGNPAEKKVFSIVSDDKHRQNLGLSGDRFIKLIPEISNSGLPVGYKIQPITSSRFISLSSQGHILEVLKPIPMDDKLRAYAVLMLKFTEIMLPINQAIRNRGPIFNEQDIKEVVQPKRDLHKSFFVSGCMLFDSFDWVREMKDLNHMDSFTGHGLFFDRSELERLDLLPSGINF